MYSRDRARKDIAAALQSFCMLLTAVWVTMDIVSLALGGIDLQHNTGSFLVAHHARNVDLFPSLSEDLVCLSSLGTCRTADGWCFADV
jgi:hypothetical protein